MDDLVEVATFTFPNETDILETLLQDAGISYFLRNENSALVVPSIWTGGIGLVVKSPDVQATVELLKRDGFGKYLHTEFV